jgi:hypothetical protein
MTTNPIASSTLTKAKLSDVLLDGLFAGMIGAVVVAVWFLVLDVARGRPLWTPALLGNMLLHGSAAAQTGTAVNPLDVAAYTAFHFLAFIVVGVALSYMVTLFERFPIMFFVLLVLFVCLQAGFFVFDAVLGAELMHQLGSWTVVVGNLLAAGSMAFYLWRRHPSVLRGVEHLWEDDQDK